MKFIVDAEALREALSDNVTEKRNVMPVLSHAKLTCEQVSGHSVLKIMTTNLEVEIERVIEADEESETGELTCPALVLSGVLNGLKGKATITEKSGKSVLSCDGRNYKLESFPVEEFPSAKDDKPESFKEVNVPRGTFQEAVNSVFYAIAINDSRPALNGLILSGDEVVGMDGLRISTYKIGEGNEPFDCVIPRGAVGRMLKAIDWDNAKMTVNPDCLKIVGDQGSFRTNLICSPLPPWRDVIKHSDDKPHAIFEPEEMLATLKRVDACISESISKKNYKLALFSPGDGVIRITDENGSLDEHVAASFEGDWPEVRLNIYFLEEAVKAAGKGPTKWFSHGESGGQYIVGSEEAKLQLFMPSRR